MNRTFYAFLVLVVGLALAGFASTRSGINIPDKSLPTCTAVLAGGWVQQAGGLAQGTTKLCFCRGDGASDAGTTQGTWQWCSITLAQAAAVVCTGGSPTVCP